MEFPQQKKKNTDDKLKAQTLLWTHIFNYIDSMSLKCAVELGIPQTIHSHGNPISLPNLISSLSIPSSKTPQLRRLMQLLTHSGIFAIEDDLYALTPISTLLIKNDVDDDVSLSGFLLAMLHPVLMNPFRSLSEWFRSEEDTAFSREHGCGFWEMTGRDPNFNKVFNEAMESDSKFLMGALIEECGDEVFEGVGTLVDVGGGTGKAARAISEAYPEMKCSVLELPQVVGGVKEEEEGGGVEFIAGDMFDYVPPADAIFLKWILHGWRDEECVKILKRCKEAITTASKQNGGKVIIIDLVMGSDSCRKSTQAQLYWDVMMLTVRDGIERDEQGWSKIFFEAGFKNYKIIPALGLRSVIELYP